MPDAGAKRRLEYSLKGAKGFRAIKKKARNKAVDKLKAIAFADALSSRAKDYVDTLASKL